MSKAKEYLEKHLIDSKAFKALEIQKEEIIETIKKMEMLEAVENAIIQKIQSI